MAERVVEPADGEGPLAIVCGGGNLPFAVADAVLRRGRRVVMFPLHGFADEETVARYPHRWLWLGQVGRLRRVISAEGCRDVVLLGSVVRPAIRHLRLDWLTLRMLPRLIRSFRGGDDHVLTGVAGIFEEIGFRLVAAQALAPEILARVGAFGRCQPSARDEADIVRGLALIAAIGPFDIGQAVVVADNRVLAVEAADGTDRMLDSLATLRREGRMGLPEGVGVLVKAPKPGQDRRFDLPSIGSNTIDGVARAGLAGLAVVAGETIIAEPEQVVAAADRAKVFVIGVPGGRP